MKMKILKRQKPSWTEARVIVCVSAMLQPHLQSEVTDRSTICIRTTQLWLTSYLATVTDGAPVWKL